MKNFMPVFLLILFTPVLLIAQEPFSFEPAEPQSGENVVIRYHPAAERAMLKSADKISVYALHWASEGDPEFYEYEMNRTGDEFEIVVDDLHDGVGLLQFKFVSNGIEDDNDKDFWQIPFYDENGKVSPLSYHTLARSYQTHPSMTARRAGSDMLREYSRDKSGKYYAKAYKAWPDNKEVARFHVQFLGLTHNDADDPGRVMEEFKKVEEYILANLSDDPLVLASLIRAYRFIEETDKADELYEEFMQTHYAHSSAITFRVNEVLDREADEETQFERALTFADDFPEADQLNFVIQSGLIGNAASLDKFDFVFHWLNNFEHATPSHFISLANAMIEHEHDPETALLASEKALSMAEIPEEEERPAYVSPGMWEAYLENRTAGPSTHFLISHASVLMANDDAAGAMNVSARAYEESDGRNPFVSARYMEYLLEAGNSDKTVEVGRKGITTNNVNDDLFAHLEKAYLISHPEGDYDAFVSEAQAESIVYLRAGYIENMLNEEAPDFTLLRLDEGEVHLAGLENKVVILDFWATWCGPCVSAFPYFQEVADHFADNPDVVFLAVNTWEGDLDDERYEKVNEFIDENEYTFTVLMDEDEVVSDFEVRGIPTRITIGREGNIRFRDVGFSGAGMAQSMIVQIEMLLEDEQYAMD